MSNESRDWQQKTIEVHQNSLACLHKIKILFDQNHKPKFVLSAKENDQRFKYNILPYTYKELKLNMKLCRLKLKLPEVITYTIKIYFFYLPKHYHIQL